MGPARAAEPAASAFTAGAAQPLAATALGYLLILFVTYLIAKINAKYLNLKQ